MRRVQRSEDKEGLVKALTAGDNPVFKEIWRLLMFAAALGVMTQRRVPLGTVDSGKAMPQTYFTNNPAWPGFLYLLALVEENTSDILAGGEELDNKRIAIFEEYANGGLELLHNELETSSYSLDAVVGLIAQMTASSENHELRDIAI